MGYKIHEKEICEILDILNEIERKEFPSGSSLRTRYSMCGADVVITKSCHKYDGKWFCNDHAIGADSFLDILRKYGNRGENFKDSYDKILNIIEGIKCLNYQK